MHNFFIKIFENSPIRISDKTASKLASFSWLIFVVVILFVAILSIGSGLELLGVTYGIAGIISILASTFISPLFGQDDPFLIAGILTYTLMVFMAIIILGLIVLVAIGLAKKKLFAWWILDVFVIIQVCIYGIGVVFNPILNNLISFTLYAFALYLIYNVRRFFK